MIVYKLIVLAYWLMLAYKVILTYKLMLAFEVMLAYMLMSYHTLHILANDVGQLLRYQFRLVSNL